MPSTDKSLPPENSPWLSFFREVRRLAAKLDEQEWEARSTEAAGERLPE